MATKNKLTATIINNTLAPYGIGETIDVLSDSTWQDLGEQVDRYLDDAKAWGQVYVEYHDADGDEVDINDYL